MTLIELKTTDQVLTIVQKPTIASGDKKSVQVYVYFDSKWDGYVKSAVFYTAADPTIYEVILNNDACTVPHEVLATIGTMYVGIRGTNPDGAVKTTSMVHFRIVQGAPRGDATPGEPTPDTYQQILALMAANKATVSQTDEGAVIEITDHNGTTTASIKHGEKGDKGDPGIGADWNAAEGEPGHVLNRTHWTESKGMVQLPVSVQWGDEDGDGEHDGGFLTASLGLVIGDTYTVKWGGVEYTCVAQGVQEGDRAFPVLGDLYAYAGGAMGSASTGEPFFILDPGVEIGDGVYGIIIGLDGICDEAFTIYHVDETVHKLPNKYLDLEWLPTSKEEKGVLLEGEIGMSTSGAELYEGQDPPFTIADGAVYEVEWDGTVYECVGKCVYLDDGTLYLGYLGDLANSMFFGALAGNTGEPFCYEWYPTQDSPNAAWFSKTYKSTTVAVKVTGTNVVPLTMPEKFLPESFREIALRSQDPDSTKTIKIKAYDAPDLRVSCDGHVLRLASTAYVDNAVDGVVDKVLEALPTWEGGSY